ncbi:MAG: iron-containing alcohol dehydrogenase [Clostridiales bacterium]|nr:iron-containing alcohol dehydrogenase [Clostridiales bacterium]
MQYKMFKTTQYVLGNGSIEKLGEYIDKRIAFVVDGGIMRALQLDKLIFDNILKGADYKVVCDMKTEPHMYMLETPIREIRKFEPDVIVGIGGGSVMDTAKALWLFYELPAYDWERATKAYEVEPFPGRAELIVVPTTSGTGSETTGCAVIKDEQKRKRMILSDEIIPNLAIMDFDLLKSLPAGNIAFSGTDALAHALEAGVSKLASTMVRMQCIQAAVTIIKELPKSVRGDMEAREKIHVAATMAGAGINNSITGMAHGMDQAGGDFGKPHGLMTGLLLPYTMEYLIPQPVYEEVADQLEITGTSEEKQKRLVKRIWEMYKEVQMPVTLEEAGIPEQEYLDKIPSYIKMASQDANIIFAPKEASEAELENLYRSFYFGK